MPYETGTLVDSGFEGRADAASLDDTIWTDYGTTPQNAEYDTAQAKVGSISAWVKGPAAAIGGKKAAANLTADGGDIRFWVYLENATEVRYINIGTASRLAEVRFDGSGNVGVFTAIAGNPNGYTTNTNVVVGTYSAGWMEYRVVADFTNQRYILSRRAAFGDVWTILKRSGATDDYIPARHATTITSTDGFAFRGSSGSNVWVDDIRYSAASAIIDTPTPVSATEVDSTHTDITFDIAVASKEAAAETAANWSCDNSITISAAAMQADTKVVRLTHSALTMSTTYTFTADNDITGSGDKTAQLSYLGYYTLAGGSYTTAALSAIFAENNEINVTGRVIGTGTAPTYIDFDNADLSIFGVGSIEAWGIKFTAFRSIDGLDYIEATDYGVTGADHGCLMFPDDADYSAITDPTISNTTLKGEIRFGAEVVSGSEFTPLTDGLIFDTVVIDGRVGGSINNWTATGLDFTFRDYGIHTHPFRIDGSNNTITGTFDANLAPSALKFYTGGYGELPRQRRSSVGNYVSGSFSGAHEETLGVDNPTSVHYGTITSKSGSNVVIDDTTDVHVGMHLVFCDGDAHGNYHEITAVVNSTTLTLDTTTYALTDVANGDMYSIACAFVDNVFEDCAVTLNAGFLDFGEGCNVAMSLWGNCYGNIVRRLIATHPTTGLLHAHPTADPADYSVLGNDIGLVGAPYTNLTHCGRSINSRNQWIDCETVNCEAFLHVATIFFDYRQEEVVAPSAMVDDAFDPFAPAYSQGIVVQGCTSDTEVAVDVCDVKGVQWSGNIPNTPATTYTGRTFSDFTKSPIVFPALTYLSFYNTYHPTWASEDNWLWNYELPLGSESETTIVVTYALFLDGSFHALTSDNVAVTQVQTLAVQDGAHVHNSDTVTLNQYALELIFDDSIHAHTAETPAVTQAHIIVIGDSAHALSSDTVTLFYSGHLPLVIADCRHLHACDSVALAQLHRIRVNDSAHALTSGTVSFPGVWIEVETPASTWTQRTTASSDWTRVSTPAATWMEN